jgi:hypothetical protein
MISSTSTQKLVLYSSSSEDPPDVAAIASASYARAILVAVPPTVYDPDSIVRSLREGYGFREIDLSLTPSELARLAETPMPAKLVDVSCEVADLENQQLFPPPVPEVVRRLSRELQIRTGAPFVSIRIQIGPYSPLGWHVDRQGVRILPKGSAHRLLSPLRFVCTARGSSTLFGQLTASQRKYFQIVVAHREPMIVAHDDPLLSSLGITPSTTYSAPLGTVVGFATRLAVHAGPPEHHRRIFFSFGLPYASPAPDDTDVEAP